MLPEQTSRAGAREGSALSKPRALQSQHTMIHWPLCTVPLVNAKKMEEMLMLGVFIILIVCPHTPGDREHASHRWRRHPENGEFSSIKVKYLQTRDCEWFGDLGEVVNIENNCDNWTSVTSSSQYCVNQKYLEETPPTPRSPSRIHRS